MGMRTHWYLAWGVDLGKRSAQWDEDARGALVGSECEALPYGADTWGSALVVQASITRLDEPGLVSVGVERGGWRRLLERAQRALEEDMNEGRWMVLGWWG